MAEEEEDVGLVEEGQEINDRWLVIKKLGEGGFGAVYKVKDNKTKKMAAMKVESSTEKNQVLKMETKVLQALVGKANFCSLLDCGRTDTYNYVVMTLVGKSLRNLKKETAENRFTLSTSILIIKQCIRSIQDLHEASFVHRDLKPDNFTLGAEKQSRTVYLLDFGLARQYRKENGELRHPRSSAGFRGTLRYAPISQHLMEDFGRKDDLWSIYYMLIEFVMGKLPWKELKDMKEIGKMKKNTTASELCHGCPKEFIKIFEILSKYGFYDEPDYRAIQQVLNDVMKRKGIKKDDPFDWEIMEQE